MTTNLGAAIKPKCVKCVIKVLSDTNMSDQWRQLALEVIVTMSETAPATVRKVGKFITLLGWLHLSLLINI